jgi:hypothetical protein
MTGKNKTRLVGWHPSDPALVGWLDAEIERRGGGRGAQSAILDEALAEYRARRTATQEQDAGSTP